MTSDLSTLTAEQAAVVSQWLPGVTLLRDHSWGLVGTTVLEVRGADGRPYIVKAWDTVGSHFDRELTAHRNWLTPWTSIGRAPRLVHADEVSRVILTEYLPGELVGGSSSEGDPDIYQQAGELLALLHGQQSTSDDGEFERTQKEETLAWLERPHRISDATVARLVDHVRDWPAPPSVIVATHGDWGPRNWLVDDGRVGVIDFGRAGLRPAATDLARLASRQFLTDPELETAFLAGYGADPREPAAWLRSRVREAVGTAAWAYQVGDEPFEQQGHRMIAAALSDL